MRKKAMLEELDKKIISLIQGDLPLNPRPFAELAKEIGLSEREFVKRVADLKKRGVIRRFGATLRHQEAGKTLAEFRQVTHCYQRKTRKDWKYNLYTMIHGSNHDECYQIAERMSRAVGIHDYVLLFSEKEFRKTSMEYF
jgi:DNA-binding Lrp family transcriptional regulator